jgi:hypothetical protein
MRRPSFNFLVDSVAFVGFLFLTTTGILLHYILPPGSGKTSAVWGLGRHDWGQIHFWIAVVFLATLVLHLVLHWKWIVAMVRGRTTDPDAHPQGRVALGAVGLVALAVLSVAPLLSPIEGPASGKGEGHDHGSASTKSEQDPRKEGGDRGGSPMVRGSMTLREVEQATGVPAARLLERLNLPANFPRDERLGPLQESYGYDMEALRRVVEEVSRPAGD